MAMGYPVQPRRGFAGSASGSVRSAKAANPRRLAGPHRREKLAEGDGQKIEAQLLDKQALPAYGARAQALAQASNPAHAAKPGAPPALLLALGLWAATTAAPAAAQLRPHENSPSPPWEGGMSPQLKDLLLPQFVQDRKSSAMEEGGAGLEACDLAYVYYTTNSSSSDVASPLTPTFSNRGVPLRYSSSTSSLELPQQLSPLQQDGPTSPIAQHAAASKSSIRQLPDVQEEPLEREEEEDMEEEDDDDDDLSDNFGMYCLCDQACEHHNASQELLSTEMTGEFDIDYDLGFLSDSDFSGDAQYPKKKRIMSGESTFGALTSRIGSRFPSIARWKSQRKANSITGLMTSPTTERSLENVLSGAASSRSSSMSSPTRQFPVLLDDSPMPPPAMPFYESTDSLDMHAGDLSREERSGIERDRALATTPLLPPLMTDPLGKPPLPSPLGSPSIAPSSAVTEVHSPRVVPTPRHSMSSKPSISSLRQVSIMTELPLPLPPSILQDQDEWSDRLGHANFTITPMPYEVLDITAESVTKFCDDWDAARVAYTKHLVRTGEHYGQTSKTYGMTEAKWAEIERRWKGYYGDIVRQTQPVAPAMIISRSRSRGRGRGRSESANPAGKSKSRQHDDIYAAMQWRGRRGCLPSAVPQMLEALDAEGKFPGRGDEDIVGPMQRDAYMVRARSEEKTPRFWKNLAEKLRL
ncbi:hypothetical protein TARUN_1202 [Trichoderma arundinaceum]|uniref:Only prolin and serin are matching in the corresponding protein n=1 Tax=Trichoderma arundinaceum TaxID=490622 RepID=A0A395NY90_TRIAR|nr:hypothetical protein TARUN_1202 [Trichoderma arundinaceum]